MSIPGRLLYLCRRRSKLGLRHWYAEHFLDQRIERWNLNAEWSQAHVPIHTLTSRHDWRMALWMLASFHTATERRWPVVLHEDGSLGTEEIGLFQNLFPEIRVIRRSEADQTVHQVLKSRPRCADYRCRMPHGLKSFDIPQLTEAPRFLLFDPDVLFFKRPQKILDWVDSEDDFSCWFNQDFQEPSPIPPAQAIEDLGVPLWPRVNSGLCLLNRANVSDLDSMENWLGQPELQDPAVQWRVEQTLLALSASKTGKGGLLPSSYEVSPGRHRGGGAIARHYVGCVRDRFHSEGITQLAHLVRPVKSHR